MTEGKKVLADTCVWIEYFRTRSTLSEELKRLIQEGSVVTTGVVILELLHGAEKAKSKDLVKDTLLALPFLDTTRDTWLLAGEIGHTLRRNGITLPATDLLMAAIAKSNGCSVFTTDGHFKKIPNLDLYSPA